MKSPRNKEINKLHPEIYDMDKNESKLLLPFYLNCDTRSNNRETVLNDICWEKETLGDYYYLARHINAIVNNKSKNIGSFYKLKEQARENLKLPKASDTVHMKSYILDENSPEEFDFYLSSIRVAYFTTGIGFLILEVKHAQGETMQLIADKCNSLCRFMNNEHDSGKYQSKLEFSYQKGEYTDSFSLKNTVHSLLHVEDFAKGELVLFPSLRNRRCNIYHRILLNHRMEEDEKYLYYLRRGQHSSFLYGDENDGWNNSDYTYSPNENVYWSICQNGVVSLSYKPLEQKNDKYILKYHPRNVRGDYFFLYLLLMHEREALYWYNSEAVLYWNDTKKLISMRKKLIEFCVCFSYNAVSQEMAYQNFYDCVYKSMNLDKLEIDIQNVITQVDEFQQERNDKRTNGMLTVIALLAIFSTFVDGIALADRIVKIGELTSVHWVTVGINVAAIITAIAVYFKKK